MRELCYYCTISLDGYLADAEGSTSWMHGAPGEDYGFAEFYRGAVALLLGRKTYERMQDSGDYFPYADKPVYVFSRNADMRRAAPSVQIISDTTPETFVARLKLKDDGVGPGAGADPAGPLWLGGGSQLASALYAAGLIDEIVLHVQPIILGGGLPFLAGAGLRDRGLELQECSRAPGGFVKLRYRTVKSWRSDL